MELRSGIQNWDGKSTDVVIGIYEDNHDDPQFINTLLSFCQSVDCQVAATWLLKHWIDNGNLFSTKQSAQICRLLPALQSWEGKLHLLQCFAHLKISSDNLKKVEHFVRDCLQHKNKFVRAWAYNGFYELAKQYPHFQDEAKQFFDLAMEDEAPSVKARIRAILKAGF